MKGVILLKITALVENTSCREDVLSEHGLSLYIETDNHKILFDMGQSDLFYKNSNILNVNIENVDMAVISHGHYDHGGGLKCFLDVNKRASVYISEDAFGDYYNGTEKYIGLDKSLSDNKRLIKHKGVYRINDHLTLYSSREFKPIYPVNSGGLTKKFHGEFIEDDFLHEQYLLIKDKDKRILISGCSHNGILNVANWFNVDMIIGGFHFSKLPLDTKLESYAETLTETNTIFVTCHCTGVQQYEFMKKSMPKLHYISSGQTIDTDELLK